MSKLRECISCHYYFQQHHMHKVGNNDKHSIFHDCHMCGGCVKKLKEKRKEAA